MVRVHALTVLILLVFGSALGLGVATAAEDEEVEASPGFVVVLANGTVVPVLAEPVIAFGKVRYQDMKQRTQVVSARQVDVARTRKLNRLVPHKGPRGSFSVAGASSGSSGREASGRPGTRVASQTASGAGNTTRSRRSRSVRVYSATWCPHCQTLRRFLAENGVHATVIEVDRLSEGEQARHRQEMKRLTGRVAFPTVVVGDQAMAGYSPSWILRALGR